MNYLEFYQMSVEPFSNTPVSRFYFNSAPHSKALVRLMYAIDSMKGLAVLIGEIGSGKTTLARRLLDNLSEESYEAALLVIIHSDVDAKWLLRRIALQLGVEDPAEDKVQMLSQLYHRLTEIHDEGRKPVVLIDEAQMLCNREVMEEFRGLLNLETHDRKLLNLVFIGLPDLENCLALDPPLQQRIAVKYRLDSLDAEATEAYIKHRLRLAGAKRMLFTKEATEFVYTSSGGIPRVINTICDNALFEGYIMKAELVDTPIVRNVCTDLGFNRTAGQPATPGGTRASDFETPSEANIAPRSMPDRRTPGPMPGMPQASPGANVRKSTPSTSSNIPSMEEIDGILDGLVDK